MSLNHIKMPPQLIVGLYPGLLVETEMTVVEDQPVIELEIEEQPAVDPLIEKPTIEDPVIEERVVEEPVVGFSTTQKQQEFDFHGKNKKQIVILTTSDKAQYIPEPELKFLISVLKACGLTIEDVAILNLKNQTADHAGLLSFFQCRVVLLFGLEPQHIDLPMNFPQFQLQSFNKSIYLHAPVLHEIEKQKELKMKLWVCLKNLFSL